MKKFVLSALMLLSSLGSTQAANLYASNLGNGLTLRDSTTALSTGTLRFGIFPDGFDVAANANDIAALNAAFVEVYSFTGSLNALETNGFFQVSHSYATDISYGGLPYDGSAGVVNDVTGDIAGSKVYVWVHNNASPALATEQAIFVTNQVWADADDLVADTYVSPDTGASGLQVVVGQNANGADIGAGVASHRAGGALVSVTIARTPASASVLPGTPVTFTANVIGGLSPLYQWRKNGGAIAEETANTLVFASAQVGDTGDYDVLVNSGAAGSDSSNVVNLTVADAPPAKPEIVQQPASLIVPVGGSIDLSVGAVGAGTLKYQWKKGGNLAGATESSVSIPGATLKSAGAYNVVVTNAPGAGTGTVTSDKAEVAVVDTSSNTIPVVLGGTAKLSVAAAGKGITYQWFKDGSSLSEDKKSKSKSYTVKVTDPELAGVYTCEISGPGGSLMSGEQTVVVIDAAPEFVGGATLTLPEGTVGSDYSVDFYADFMAQDANKTPLSFKAAKLPSGLKMDSKTGVISGRPTKAGNATATITVNGSGGSVSINATIAIADFPTGLAGAFVASIPTDEVIGSGLGGRLDFTVTTKGALSGKLLLGGDAALSFKGGVSIPLEGNPVISVEIPRKTSYLPLTLNLEINTTSGLLENATLSEQDSSVALTGWRNNAVGAAYEGLTTFGLQIPVELEGDAGTPQGVSHGTITVKSPAGTATVVGRTSDGEKITGSTFVGPEGQVVIHNAYYKPFKGSLTGVLDLNRGASAEDDTITGSLTWTRPAATSTNTRLYQEVGFGPLELTPVGGRYVVPESTVILGLAADSTASLNFAEAGISEEENNPSVLVTLLAKNKLTIAENPEKTTLKVDYKKGVFSGAIIQPTKRKGSFLGLAVRTSPTTVDGLGYFLLAQPPEGSEAANKTPVLSGYVSLELSAGPPPPCAN